MMVWEGVQLMRARSESIEVIRRFNRHYVPVMRLLDKGYLDTGMSTMEVDILIEIANHKGCSARDIATELRLDKGYLSRLIRDLEKNGLISRTSSDVDGRLQLLSLTDDGAQLVSSLEQSGSQIVDEVFAHANDAQLSQVADAMDLVLDVLGNGEEGSR
jgi:DNA-binding MarR family transcriptional regulator